jgi:LPS-assembly lipoprotein
MKTRRNFVLTVAALALAGCGFRPLYGNSGPAGENLDLSSVTVDEQQDRPGQLVRNELLRVMSAEPARYTLRFRVASSDRPTSSLPGTVTSRYGLTLNATYDLLESGSNKKLESGRTFSTVSYDVVRQPVADRQAAEAATSRAAIEIANDIRLRVAVRLAKLQDSQ